MASRPQIQSLTGLRGVAALCVLLTHYLCSGMVFSTDKSLLPSGMPKLFNLSFTGMTAFFVLSGFVIAYNYAGMDWAGRPYASCFRFMGYRFARLYPLLAFFILFTIWRNPNVFDVGLQQPAMRYELLRQLTMTQSLYPYLDAEGRLPAQGIFNLSWSISTEFCLYVSFALMMLVSGRIFRVPFSLRLVAIYGAVAAAFLFLWTRQNGSGLFATLSEDDYRYWLFYNSPYYRALEFCMGMAAFGLFTLHNERRAERGILKFLREWGPLAGLLMLGLSYSARLEVWTGKLAQVELWDAGAIFLMLQACAKHNWLNACLKVKPFVFVGEISYSLYLFHVFASTIGTRNYGGEVVHPLLVLAANFCLAVFLSLTLAYGFYSLVEVPGRRGLRRLARAGARAIGFR